MFRVVCRDKITGRESYGPWREEHRTEVQGGVNLLNRDTSYGFEWSIQDKVEETIQ